MLKNYKLATVWAILLWFIIFAVYSVLMFAVKQYRTDLLMIILSPLLVLFCGWMYFKEMKEPTFKEGMFLGIYFILVGTILDVVVTVPLFVGSFSAYYGDWTLWVSFGLTVVFGGLSAYVSKQDMMAGKQKESRKNKKNTK